MKPMIEGSQPGLHVSLSPLANEFRAGRLLRSFGAHWPRRARSSGSATLTRVNRPRRPRLASEPGHQNRFFPLP
jgi:hypothetical protein